MKKTPSIDWHDLSEEEQEIADSECNDGEHGRLTQEKGSGGGTGDYMCTECGILKSGQQWESEGLR
ncbi:MAG: hypothetical protein KUG82_18910 [Pseudomonadales bacterium]|nr:hypothetical protein [Pseudomonadales bacterium]